jgi:hypothetical protein
MMSCVALAAYTGDYTSLGLASVAMFYFADGLRLSRKIRDIAAGKDATGLCTVRGAVSEMIKSKCDQMEMIYAHDGEMINVELLIISRRPSWIDGGYDSLMSEGVDNESHKTLD